MSEPYNITLWDTPTTNRLAVVTYETERALKIDGQWIPKKALQKVDYGYRFKRWWHDTASHT